MSHLSAGAAQSSQYSQLAGLVIGALKLYDYSSHIATTPVIYNEVVDIPAAGGQRPNFGDTARYVMPKTSTLLDEVHIVNTISAGVLAGGRSAAYVNNFGDLLAEEITLRYGSTILQSIPGVWHAAWRRISRNDVNIEGVNALVLGGLPPAGATETIRQDAVTNGVVIYTPLEELYFVHDKSQCWMPEAHSLEGEIIVKYSPLARLVYSDNGADPFTTAPAITESYMRICEVTLSATEKAQRLQTYAGKQGQLHKFLDLERVENVNFTGTGTANPRILDVPLDNFRMDMVELLFMLRTATDSASATAPAVDKDWAGDPLEASTNTSNVTGASVGTVKDITSYQLLVNGKILQDTVEDLWNRAKMRKRAHPDAQIASGIYVHPFAVYPEERKNATGHISAQMLGNLVLRITVPDWAATETRRVDVFSHSHNAIQEKSGGVAKALH